jgi:SRSO17 transposase
MRQENLSSSSSPEALWTEQFDRLCERLSPCVARSETRASVTTSVRGLLSPIERKNGWQVAEEAGLPTPSSIQSVLTRAVWERDEGRDVLHASVLEALGPGGILVREDTGVLKKGEMSVGVQRHDSGTAGRIEQCQRGVCVTSAQQEDHTLVDREVSLPKTWTDNRTRCRAAHVPDTVSVATTPEVAARMLCRTLDAGRTASWVTGDTVSGRHGPRRQCVEARGQASALAVSCSEQVSVHGTHRRVDEIADGWDVEHWQRITVGNGSKGPRDVAWACTALDPHDRPGWQTWLLVRRRLVSGAKPAERAYARVCAPCGTPLAQMARALGARWSVE